MPCSLRWPAARYCATAAPRCAAAARPCSVIRGIGIVGSAIAFILSLGYLPVAEATAINFVTPLLITVLAIPVLGETVRPQGWAAVLVGFAGVLVVVRPGLGGLHPAALLVVLSSLCWCVGHARHPSAGGGGPVFRDADVDGIDRLRAVAVRGAVLPASADDEAAWIVPAGRGDRVVRGNGLPCWPTAMHGRPCCAADLRPVALVLGAGFSSCSASPGSLDAGRGGGDRVQRRLCGAPGTGARGRAASGYSCRAAGAPESSR